MGLYVAFEGQDGAGKTTALAAVAEALAARTADAYPDLNVVVAKNPGATALGAHLRRLLKDPASILGPAGDRLSADPLTQQLLMLVDHQAFVNEILVPAVNAARPTVVLADRSNLVSGIVYGINSGLKPAQLSKMHDLVTGPKLDRLYVLNCPFAVANARLAQRAGRAQTPDAFEDRGTRFRRAVADTYEALITGPAQLTVLVHQIVSIDNVVYLNSANGLGEVVDAVLHDIRRLLDLHYGGA